MLSTQTVIIVAVCGGVGALILILVIWRLLRACLQQSTPLPPPQALAYHREREAASRPATMYNSSSTHSLVAPALPFASYTSSQSSLSASPPRNTRHMSYSTDEGTAESGSDLTHSHPMQPSDNPNNNFHLVSPTSADSFYFQQDHHDLSPPASSSTLSHASASRSQIRSTRSFVSSHSRPTSVADTLRGVPHSQFSSVQLMMPAPLAQGMDGPASRRSSTYSSRRNSTYGAGDRRSMVDGWASLPVQTGRSDRPRERERSNSMSESRPSTSSLGSSSNANHNVLRAPRRASSSFSPTPSYPPGMSAPPVPKIPAIYNTYGPQAGSELDLERQRAKAMALASAPAVITSVHPPLKGRASSDGYA